MSCVRCVPSPQFCLLRSITSKTNTQSFHKSDSQGWLLQACHGTVNLALDSWTHSFILSLLGMCQALCWGYNTDILTAQLFRLVGRNRHINRVMMQKLHTVTNLPGNRFCWSQSNLNIYLIYQNFLHGYIFFNMKMHVTGFSGGITKSDQAPTYEQLNS